MTACRLSPWAIFAIAVSVAGCAEHVADPITGDPDRADAKSVLGSVFYAARTGEIGHLADLCDPEGNAAVMRICRLEKGTDDYRTFRAIFSRGHLNGEPRISGDTAVIKFLYGRDGTDRETMNLVRRDGRWYLSSF